MGEKRHFLPKKLYPCNLLLPHFFKDIVRRFRYELGTGLVLRVAIQTKPNTASVRVSQETQVCSDYEEVIGLEHTQKPQPAKLIVFFLA